MASQPTVYATLTHAPSGFYVEYEQVADETGQQQTVLVYVGPFASLELAAAEAEKGPDPTAKIIRHP